MIEKNYFKESLKLVIYTIGYSIEGESILVLVKADDIVVYTIVIDGYKVRECNVTHELLRRNQISHIDLFCWSHPDKDHSVGIEDYITYMNSKTTVIVSDGYEQTVERWKNANTEMYDFLQTEFYKDLRIKERVDIRTASTGKVFLETSFVDVRTGIEHPLRVDSFAPSDFQNVRRSLMMMELLNNHISVGLRITIGQKAVVFCADIPNVIFNSMKESDFPSIIDYIKIPHHGSKGSDKVLDKYSNIAEVACTTVNVKNGLPNIEVLNQYKNRTRRLFCTNDLKNENQNELGGVVKTIFCIDNDVDASNVTYGNAKEVI